MRCYWDGESFFHPDREPRGSLRTSLDVVRGAAASSSSSSSSQTRAGGNDKARPLAKRMPRFKGKYSAQADGEDIEVTDDEAGANAVESSDPPAKAAPILEGVVRLLIEFNEIVWVIVRRVNRSVQLLGLSWGDR